MSSTFNLKPGLTRLAARMDVKPATLFKKLNGTCPSLTQSKLGRIALGYTWANEDELRALAKSLGVSASELAGLQGKSAATPVTAPAGLAASKVETKTADTSASASAHPMPPAQVPAAGTLNREEHRTLLNKELGNARQMLHVPKLPAAHWAAWRAYEKQLMAQLGTA